MVCHANLTELTWDNVTEDIIIFFTSLIAHITDCRILISTERYYDSHTDLQATTFMLYLGMLMSNVEKNKKIKRTMSYLHIV